MIKIEGHSAGYRCLISIYGPDCAESKAIRAQIRAESLGLTPCTLTGCTSNPCNSCLDLRKEIRGLIDDNGTLQAELNDFRRRIGTHLSATRELDEERMNFERVKQGEFGWRGKCELFVGVVLGYMAGHKGAGSWCPCNLCQKAVEHLAKIDITLPFWGVHKREVPAIKAQLYPQRNEKA